MTASALTALFRPMRRPGAMVGHVRAGSLGGKALTASAWTLLGFAVQYPLRLAGNLVMAHLLAPEAFGLMALVLTLHLGLSLLSDVGIGQSIMRDPNGDTPRFLRTCWAVQILRGLGLAGGLLIFAGAAHWLGPALAAPGSVYADPGLPALIAASAVVFVIAGLQSTNLFLAVRRLQAKRHMLVELAAQVTALVAMLGCVVVVPSVWALLAGAVANAAAKTVLSHLVMPGPRMRWTWDKAQASGIWRFGRWLIGASVGGFLIAQGDKLVLSGLVGAEMLGVYAIAALWVEAGRQVLMKIASFVFVPSFSAVLRDRPDAAGSVLRRALGYFALACLAVSLAAAGVGVAAIQYLYDARYEGAAAIIAVLSLRSVTLCFVVLEHFLLARGNSRSVAVVKLTGGGVSILGLIGGYLVFGLPGALVAAACASVPASAAMLAHPDIRCHLSHWTGALALASIVLASVMLVVGLLPA